MQLLFAYKISIETCYPNLSASAVMPMLKVIIYGVRGIGDGTSSSSIIIRKS
jgi:hypothetical protein